MTNYHPRNDEVKRKGTTNRIAMLMVIQMWVLHLIWTEIRYRIRTRATKMWSQKHNGLYKKRTTFFLVPVVCEMHSTEFNISQMKVVDFYRIWLTRMSLTLIYSQNVTNVTFKNRIWLLTLHNILHFYSRENVIETYKNA